MLSVCLLRRRSDRDTTTERNGRNENERNGNEREENASRERMERKLALKSSARFSQVHYLSLCILLFSIEFLCLPSTFYSPSITLTG